MINDFRMVAPRPNTAYRDLDGSRSVVVSIRDIVAGEEILVDYGDDYWLCCVYPQDVIVTVYMLTSGNFGVSTRREACYCLLKYVWRGIMFEGSKRILMEGFERVKKEQEFSDMKALIENAIEHCVKRQM